MSLATAMQAFVDTWQSHAGIDLDPTENAAMEAASAAFAAALPTFLTAAPIVGTATLVGGTVTVNNANAHPASTIFVTRKTRAGTVGNIAVGTIVDGVSFVINSDQAADTSVVNWWIVN